MPAKTKLDFREILLKQNYISEENLRAAELASKNKKISFLDYLFSEGLISKDLLGQAVSEHYGVAYADLNTQIPPVSQILTIPEALAKKYHLVLFKVLV